MPGAAGGGGGGQAGEDGSTAIIWAIAAIFVIGFIVWMLFQNQIYYGYMSLKLWEIDLLKIFTRSTHINDTQALIQNARLNSTIDFNEMVANGQMVGTYLRIPFVAILLALAVVVYFGNTVRTFKNIYSMKTLAINEKTNWPQISPVVNLNLVKADINSGPWAMAMTPILFCKKHKLIDEFRRERQEGVSRRDAAKVEVGLRRGDSNKLFALQLGRRWEGVNRLAPHIKALFAVFAARIDANTKPAADLLRQINSSPTSKLDYRGVDALLKKHENSKIVKKITDGHAYVFTVMAAMIVAARLDGVQATADFIWLKPLDRSLWYVLNTMGRQTPFVEAAGAYSHYVAEKEAGRRLVMPMVEGATNALELALKSMVYHPDEEK